MTKIENSIIKFDKEIYSQKAIKLTIQAYQELADFNLSQKGKYFQVELKNIDQDVKDVINEDIRWIFY